MKRQENYEKQIAVLEKYKQVDVLERCNILHLYDTKQECFENDGYYDSRFFELWAFNSKTNEKKFLGRKDGIEFGDYANVSFVRIFIDGSTFIRFKNEVAIGFGQCINFY